MKKKYPVILTQTQREYLRNLIAAGTAPARKLTHARILLKADQGSEGPGWVDEQVADAVEVSQPTVSRVRKHYFEEGLEAALNRRPPNREYHRKLDGEQEARLVALACTYSRRWAAYFGPPFHLSAISVHDGCSTDSSISLSPGLAWRLGQAR
jgi:hypothetical protein